MGMQQDHQQVTKIKQRSDPNSLDDPITEVTTVWMLGLQPDISFPQDLCRQTEQPG